MFTCWAADGSRRARVGLPAPAGRPARGTGRRSPGAGEPLLHVTEWDVPPRADPLLVKAHGLWAEHMCDAPMEQWTVANETYATALDDPADALGRAYGMPTAVAFDLEWYATAPPSRSDATATSRRASSTGSSSSPAAPLRLDRSAGPPLAPLGRRARPARAARRLRPHRAAGAVRVPRRHVADWVLTPDGWRSAPRAPAPASRRRRRRRRRRTAGAGRPARPATSTAAQEERHRRRRGRGRWRRGRRRTRPTRRRGRRRCSRASSPRRVAGVGRRRRDVDRQRRHRHPALESACMARSLLERRLAVRQLALDPHDRLDVGRLVVQLPDAGHARPLVVDPGVEVGQLVGDVLGQLVERLHGAERRRGRRDGVELAGRHGDDERARGGRDLAVRRRRRP